MCVVDVATPAILASIVPAAPTAKFQLAAVDPTNKLIAAVCADGSAAVFNLASAGWRGAEGVGGAAEALEPLRSVSAGPLFDDDADENLDVPRTRRKHVAVRTPLRTSSLALRLALALSFPLALTLTLGAAAAPDEQPRPQRGQL